MRADRGRCRGGRLPVGHCEEDDRWGRGVSGGRRRGVSAALTGGARCTVTEMGGGAGWRGRPVGPQPRWAEGSEGGREGMLGWVWRGRKKKKEKPLFSPWSFN